MGDHRGGKLQRQIFGVDRDLVRGQRNLGLQRVTPTQSKSPDGRERDWSKQGAT